MLIWSFVRTNTCESLTPSLFQMNEEETKALKEKIVSTRKERHKITQKEALARWSYEENVRLVHFGYEFYFLTRFLICSPCL